MFALRFLMFLSSWRLFRAVSASFNFWQFASLNPLNSDAPSCARKQNPSEIPMRPHAPCQKWLVLIGCSLET